MTRYVNPIPVILDSNGDVIVGAKKYFYEVGTTTLKAVYSDVDFDTPIANPVLSLSGGLMPEVYLEGFYKEVQTDENDEVLWTRDPVGDSANSQTVANKTAAVLIAPTTARNLQINSSDGGLFYAVTGAAAATYSDNGGDYCGTVFIPTGGDGSAAWLRIYDGAVYAEWFGVTDDGVTDYTSEFILAESQGVVEVLSGSYVITGVVTGDFYTHGVVNIIGGTVNTISKVADADVLSEVSKIAVESDYSFADRDEIIDDSNNSNIADPDITDQPEAADASPTPLTATSELLWRVRNSGTGATSAQSSSTLGTFGVTRKYDAAASTQYTASMHGAPLGFIFYDVSFDVQEFDVNGEWVSDIVATVDASKREMTFTTTTGVKVAFNIRNSVDFSNSDPLDSANLDLCLNRVMLNTGATALGFSGYSLSPFAPTVDLFNGVSDESIKVTKQESFFYIRAKAQQSTTKDIVWRFLINHVFNRNRVDSRTGVVDIYGVRFIDSTSTDTVEAFNLSTNVHSSGMDESCPVRLNSMFVAGGHGVIGYTAAMVTHGKVNADVGSTWSDGTDTWVLYHIIDADTLHLVRLNTGTTDKWVISSADFATTTLTHVAGATNTANIVMTSSAQDQFIPIIRDYLAELRVDDTAITTNGDYIGTRVTLSEVYSLLGIGEQQADLITNVGDSSPSYDQEAIGEQVRFYYEYEWNYLGAMSIRAAHGVKSPYARTASVDYWAGIQLQRLSLDSDSPVGMHNKVFVYIPEVAPVSGLDFESIAEVTSNAASVTVPKSSCDDTSDPASHFCLIGKDSGDVVLSGHVFGYSREDGLGVPATRAANITDVYNLSTAEKNYPHAIDDADGDAVADDTDLVTSFRAPFLPTDTDLTIPGVIVTMNGNTYCYITAHQNLSNKSVSIPSKYNGWLITAIKSSANVTVINDYVTDNAIIITVINSYGDIILRLGD